MTARNFLTLLGALCSAFGKPMMIQAPTPTLFWVGMVLDSGGTALLGARALMSEPSKGKKQ